MVTWSDCYSIVILTLSLVPVFEPWDVPFIFGPFPQLLFWLPVACWLVGGWLGRLQQVTHGLIRFELLVIRGLRLE